MGLVTVTDSFPASFADVQPYYITYAEAWTYQAFDIRIENGVFHGRGVTDPKGNVLMAIHVSFMNMLAGAAALFKLVLLSSTCIY